MKYAYVTLATNEMYIECAKLMDISMQRVKTKYPLLIMVPEEFKGQAFLEEDKYHYVFIHKDEFELRTMDFTDTINKFQCLNLIEYDKVFFLDADIIVFKNIDHMFDIYKDEYFYAQWNPMVTMYGPGGHGFDGKALIFTPEKGKYEEILNTYNRKFYTDVFILNDIYPPNTNFKEEQDTKYNHSWYDFLQRIGHDGLPIKFSKFWTIFPKSFFLSLTDDELQKFFTYWQEYKKNLFRDFRDGMLQSCPNTTKNLSSLTTPFNNNF